MKAEENFEREQPEYSNPTVGKIWSLIEYYGLSLKEAASELNLSYKYVRKLASLNHIHIRSRSKARKVTSRNVTSCSECGGSIIRVDGETVCQECGLVAPTINLSSKLPYNTTYAHVSALSFGKSLGSETGRGRRGLFQVLAKAQGGREDIGLRAKQIRIFQSTLDPHQTLRLLSEGSKIIKQLGLFTGVENYSPISHQIGERYGAILRKVGTWLSLSKTRPRNYRRLALAALYVTLDDFPILTESLAQQPEKMDIVYGWKAEDLKLVLGILSIGKTEKEG